MGLPAGAVEVQLGERQAAVLTVRRVLSPSVASQASICCASSVSGSIVSRR